MTFFISDAFFARETGILAIAIAAHLFDLGGHFVKPNK
jgi:hypothetical protein